MLVFLSRSRAFFGGLRRHTGGDNCCSWSRETHSSQDPAAGWEVWLVTSYRGKEAESAFGAFRKLEWEDPNDQARAPWYSFPGAAR